MKAMTWAWRVFLRVFPRVCLGAAGTLLLGACTTAYQRMGITGGYSEQQLSTNVYRVTFAGNGNTPKDMVERFFMYRCAELTREKGYKYFTVLRNGETSLLEQPDRRLGERDAGLARKAAYVPAPGDARDMRDAGGGYQKVRGGSGGGGARYYYVPGGTTYITTWTGRATIRLLNDMGMNKRVVGYVAEDVMRQLGPYVLDQTHMVRVELPGPVLIDSTYGVLPLRPAPETAAPAQPAEPAGPSAADQLRDPDSIPTPPGPPATRPNIPPGGAGTPSSNPTTDKAT